MAVKRVIAASLPLAGCAMDAADTWGVGLFGLAVLIVLPILIYPPLKSWLEHREHRRRMSREWREAPYGVKPKKRVRRSASRS